MRRKIRNAKVHVFAFILATVFSFITYIRTAIIGYNSPRPAGSVIIMTGKRSRLEMYLDVLEKISQGVSKPTNIMYRCNLSWCPLQEILRSLIEKGLIEEIKKHDRKYYVITKKGKEILIYLGKLIRMLHPSESKENLMSSSKSGLLLAMQRDLNSPSIFHPQERGKKEDD